MAVTPEKVRRANAALAMGAKALLACGVQVPAGPTMSLGARAQDQQRQGPPGWGIPTDPQAAQELARLAQTVAESIRGPDDRRRASPAARGRQSLHAVGAAMAKAPTAARAALPRTLPRNTDDVNAASRATWQAYRAQSTGGAA